MLRIELYTTGEGEVIIFRLKIQEKEFIPMFETYFLSATIKIWNIYRISAIYLQHILELNLLERTAL